MVDPIFKKRFTELEEQLTKLPHRPNHGGMSGTHVPSGFWEKWATSAQNLILAVYGKESPHYINFSKELNHCRGYDDHIRSLGGVFRSAKEDFEGGYVFSVDLKVSGEVFGDFIVMAKQALLEGHKDVAAVLASAALEDALKRFAAANSLEVNDKSMQEVINALKSKGLVAGAQKSLLDAMPKLRDHAMHANWEKIDASAVSGILGFVEQFLLSKFTP